MPTCPETQVLDFGSGSVPEKNRGGFLLAFDKKEGEMGKRGK